MFETWLGKITKESGPVLNYFVFENWGMLFILYNSYHLIIWSVKEACTIGFRVM